MTVFPVVGVSSALWTFHYWGDGKKEKQDELDIGFPGRTRAGSGQAPGNALFTNYAGHAASSLWDCAGTNPGGNGCRMWDPASGDAHEACIG